MFSLLHTGNIIFIGVIKTRFTVVIQIINAIFTNNTRINSVFQVFTTVNSLLPTPVLVTKKNNKKPGKFHLKS